MKKNIIKTLIPVFVFLLTFNQILTAQDNPPAVFAEVACFKAKTPGASKLFTEYGKPFHEALIKKGVIVDWHFYKVDFPNGADCDCNYREVRFFTDIKSLDILHSDKNSLELAKALWPDKNLEELIKTFEATVEFKNSTVYVMRDELVSGPVEANMIMVNYMNVEQGNEHKYVKMENEIYKPVHKARNEAGKLLDWSLWERLLPYGSDFEGTFVTVDVWGSLDNMSKPDPENLWKTVHPDKNPGDMYQKMAKARDLVRAEMWLKLVDADVPQPQDSSSSKN